MSFDKKIFGDKIRRFRDQLKLSLEEVTYKSGIDKIRLDKLEKGEIEPTGDEILIFSDLYKQDYKFFISNQQKAASEQIEILYRKHGDDFSREDRWIIQEFLFLCECEHYVFKKLEINNDFFSYKPKGTFYKAHGEDAAKELRTWLKLNEDQIISNPYLTFRKLGVHIFRRKLINSKISGLFVQHPIAGRCILINYSEDIYRQNFTLAHEMAHAIFDFKNEINVSYDSEDNKNLKEVRANNFASSLLIPKSILNHLRNVSITQDLFLSIAKQLQVNAEPLSIALFNSDIISASQKQQLSRIKIEKSEKIDPELKDLTDKILSTKKGLIQRGLSDFYVRNCFKAYENGVISAGRLAEMLLCTELELEAILNLFNYRLSYDN